MCPDQLHKPQPDSAGQNRRGAWLRLLLPLIIILIGIAVAIWMMQSGPKAKARPKVRNAALVDVRTIEFGPQTTTISVMGTVEPQREVDLKPQVSGEIIQMSSNLLPGGHFAMNEQLLAIDPSDYHLAVKQLASEWSTNSIGLGALSPPEVISGSSASTMKGFLRVSSSRPTAKSPV